MKKLVLATVLASMFGIASAAGPYASLTYDEKDKQNSSQVNYVYGLNVGQKFSNGLGLEARMEDERVEPGAGATQKQESLAQAKVSYDISTGTMLTPYVAAALGHKNKSTIDFHFWLAEAGVKALAEQAEKLLSNESIKQAYNHFMLLCKLCAQEQP